MAYRAGSFARGYLGLVAILCLLIGLVLTIGGVWLIILGGSWYYAIAGVGLMLSGAFLWRWQMAGVWVYLAVFAGTVAWALWERGLTLWPQVPRILGPAILLILVLLTIPILRRRPARAYIGGVAAVLVIAAGSAGLLAALRPMALTAQTGTEATATELAGAEVAAAQPAPAVPVGADWPAYGGTYAAQRYSPLDQITPANVGQLELAWEFRTGDMPTEASEGRYSPENTPLKIGDDVFVCSAMGIVIAVDARNGAEKWRHDPQVPTDAIPYGATCRGVAFYAVPDAPTDAACARRILWGTLDARLIAVDAATGAL